MPEFQDLAPLDYFGKEAAGSFVAIGWLAEASAFARGPVSSAFFDQLKILVEERFEPVASAGVHECDLCQFDGPVGVGNLFVPDGERMFVCPELVVHYVAAHRYQPPTQFQEAVMRCPRPSERDYRRQFLRAGGRHLLT